MARRLITAPRAAEGFRDARKWLFQPGSGAAAHRRWQAIKMAWVGLRNTPCRWPRSLEHPGYRKASVSGYQIVYRVDPDTEDNDTAGDVLVVAVFGPGQDQLGVE